MLSTINGMKHIEVDKTISFLWVEPFLRLIYMVTKDISDKRTSRSDEVGFQDDIGPIDQSEAEGLYLHKRQWIWTAQQPKNSEAVSVSKL